MIIKPLVDRLPPPLLDGGLAVLTAAMLLFVVNTVVEPGARPPDALAYGLIIATAAPIAVRRRYPRTVLLISAWGLNTYYSLGYAGFSPFLALAVPLYTVAVTGHLRVGAAVAAWVVLAGAVFRGAEGESVQAVVPGTLTEAALIIGLLVLGDAVRVRRELRIEIADRVARAEADVARAEADAVRAAAEASREADRRAIAERLTIARDLHDVLAHTVSVVGVQANVAAETFDRDPRRSREAIEAIRGAGREALLDVRNTIGVLRASPDGETDARPAPGLADLPDLMETAREAGLAVEFETTGDDRVALPPSMELTAYRVIQESITNTIRHARATSVRVTLSRQLDAVTIAVVDDGDGGGVAAGGGHGLIGMRERVLALRGRITVGAAPDGGFAVRIHLPVGR